MMCEKISLLDVMAVQMGCMYLSDLRFLSSGQRVALARKLEKIPPRTSDLHDWNDALDYLVGGPAQPTAEEARAALIAGLSAP